MRKLKDLLELESSGVISKKELAEKIAAFRLGKFSALLSQQVVWIQVATIWGVSSLALLLWIEQMSSFVGYSKIVAYFVSPLIFILSFVLVAGLSARLGIKGIVEGKYPRTSDHPIYALRRIYGTAWSQLYYFKPVYSAVLAIPALKLLTFKLFGLPGPGKFVVYPDSWIRDLPLLKIGKNAYIANRCTIGTNLCLNDGSILVGPCEIGDGSMIGHLAIYGLGNVCGKNSELGVSSATGIRVKIGDNVCISPRATIYHGCVLEDGCKIGVGVTVGTKVRVGKNVEVHPGAYIPAGTNVENQSKADEIYAKEKQGLETYKTSILELLKRNKIEDALARSS